MAGVVNAVARGGCTVMLSLVVLEDSACISFHSRLSQKNKNAPSLCLSLTHKIAFRSLEKWLGSRGNSW
jgi:hypothetical protein